MIFALFYFRSLQNSPLPYFEVISRDRRIRYFTSYQKQSEVISLECGLHRNRSYTIKQAMIRSNSTRALSEEGIAVLTTGSVKKLLVCNTDFLGKWVKNGLYLVCILKFGQYFEKLPNPISAICREFPNFVFHLRLIKF